MENLNNISNPYKLFFPLAIFIGLWASGLWLLHGFQIIQMYPGQDHALLMIGGFFTSCVAGFLMTATPRFTQTKYATRLEVYSLFVALIILPLTSFIPNRLISYLVLEIQYAFLFRFFISRYMSRKNEPSESFILIVYGFSCAIIGILILTLCEVDIISSIFLKIGRILFFQGYPLVLILGVGSRILVAFNGWDPYPKLPLYLNYFHGRLKILFHLIGTLIITALIISNYNTDIELHIAGNILTFIILFFISIIYWRLHKAPRFNTKLNWGIWISEWCLVLGYLGMSLFRNFSVHFFHLSAIGGFGLMSLMIATRVVLSHGGYHVEKESQRKLIYLIIGLSFLAALTRLTAGLMPSTYLSHLIYAATIWIFVLSIWFIKIGKKIWSQSNASTC